MNDFDRYLEIKLRDMLDPVVGVQPPARGLKDLRRPAIELVGETVQVPVAEPVVVTLPVAPLHTA